MKAGKRAALAALFRRYYPMLYDYAVKLSRQTELAKDCIQEVFVTIWERRATISAAQSVRAYLLVMLRRQVLQMLKGQRAPEFEPGLLSEEYFHDAFSPEALLIMEEEATVEKQIVAEAIRSIPPRLREAVYLKVYDGLRYHEIAVVMDVSPQVVRNYLSDAYHRLRKIIHNLQATAA